MPLPVCSIQVSGSMSERALSLASRLVDPNGTKDDDLEDDDAIFAELEAEIENDDNAAVREHGFEHFKQEHASRISIIRIDRVKEMHNNAHGQYTEVTNEKEVIRISANEPRCIIHFYHTNFRRCEIMDKHLAKLAPKYFSTRFIRVFVENVPWLVERLAIKVLPCVICFADGVSKDRLIGFEELGNDDVFDTAVLELRLSTSGVLQKGRSQLSTGVTYDISSTVKNGLRQSKQQRGDDEDFDLDD
ncbi:thioredoxin-like protein [Hygrophoropsis aurantiaca]|uniref:Thioredoxin-like protein n=1 Tax=Hygrophoropsis aurantiaca TaxID=72124 RepID=A0ACB8ALG1_9AGAM|nr:thioredoxin-like protein [Hygrophoropsis aurantiaca]